MRHAFSIALAFCAVLGLMPGAHAQEDHESLKHFLARCDAGDPACVALLEQDIEDSTDAGILCPPANLPEADAAAAELAWIRKKAASDASFAAGTELNAVSTAGAALWSCLDKY